MAAGLFMDGPLKVRKRDSGEYKPFAAWQQLNACVHAAVIFFSLILCVFITFVVMQKLKSLQSSKNSCYLGFKKLYNSGGS